LVQAAHELAEEDVVLDVLDRLVRLRGRRPVIHGQEDARHGLREECKQRRGAERVEPVGPLWDLAVEKPPQEWPGAGALVDPADDRDRSLGEGLLAALAIGLPLALAG